MVDIHTHILPGWDDGARNMEDSLEMARMAAADGVKTIVATPHAYWQNIPISGESIRAGVAEVNRAVKEAGIPVEVVTGAEVPMERRLASKLDSDPSWTYAGNGVYLLLEPPWGALPDYCFTLIQQLIDLGITPVIAHPERSPDLQANPALIGRMIQMGALAQVTANSLMGKHGGGARSVGERILKNGWVHVISSDAHNAKNRAPVLSEARAEITRMMGEELAQKLFEENPQQIVDGMPLAAVQSGGISSQEKSSGKNSLFERMFRRRK